MMAAVSGASIHEALVWNGSASTDDIQLGHGGAGRDAQVCRRQVMFRARRICEQFAVYIYFYITLYYIRKLFMSK